MAAPNIVNVTSIVGKTAALALTTTNQDIVVNATNSGRVLKINNLSVANINGTAAASVTAILIRNNTEYRIASTIFVPANATLVVISKDAAMYLEEGDTIRIVASLNNYLHAICSYEIIT